MNSIYEIENKIKRYLPHDFKTKLFAVKLLRSGNSISFVCRKYHVSRTSVYRWNKKYNGNDISLKDKSHRPLSKHPNAHSDIEIKWINDYIRRNPNITLNELCLKENIYHHKIQPRTPRHNGKVERSHRNDNERFYNYLKFYSLDDLRYQAKLYLKRSNDIPMSVLNYKTSNEMKSILTKKINSIA